MHDLSKDFGKIVRDKAKYYLNFTTKVMHINNTEAMGNIIKYGVEGQLLDFIRLVYDGKLIQKYIGNLIEP